MGNKYNFLIKQIKNALGNSLFTKSSVYLFGSRITGTFCQRSDWDILILTSISLTLQDKKKITELLEKQNINSHVFTYQAWREAKNHSFVESAAFESASRYAVKISGKGHSLKAQMSDQDLLIGMYVIGLFRINWIEEFTNLAGMLKELQRMTLVIWCLEGRVALENIYSLGHFINWSLHCKKRPFPHDILWQYLDESELLWGWLEEGSSILERHRLLLWAKLLRERAQAHKALFKQLKLGSIPEELYYYQLSDRRLKGVRWQQLANKKLIMADDGIQFIINVVKRDRRFL